MPRDDLLAWADIVTLHAPAQPDRKPILGAREIALMKRTAILINTARGSLVDEGALVAALQEKRLHGAGLDVFAAEPPALDNPIFGLPNVVLSPHMATGTRDSIIEKTRAYCRNIHRVIDGQTPLGVINPDAWAV
jgi:phosphoglycerate dehydrogenase-like enzyme